MRSLWVCAVLASPLLVAPLLALDGLRAATSKPLSAILKVVADAGYVSVTEVSYDDGQWEVEAIHNGQPIGLRIDPQSAKVLNEHVDEPHPQVPGAAKPLIKIVRQLEKKGFSPVKKAELELAGWEVEALHNGQWRDLLIDLDGKIVSDQLED